MRNSWPSDRPPHTKGSPVEELTPDQQQTLEELRAEVKAIQAEADEKFGEYNRRFTEGDRDADKILDEVLAMDEEARLKKLIAWMPTGGEGRVGKIRNGLLKLGFNGALKRNSREVAARQKTLEFVNDFRESHGLPKLDRLPVGVMGDSHECVIARALVIWDNSENGLMQRQGMPKVEGQGSIAVHSPIDRVEPRYSISLEEVKELWSEELLVHFTAWLAGRSPSANRMQQILDDEYELADNLSSYSDTYGYESPVKRKYWFVDTFISAFDDGEYPDLAATSDMSIDSRLSKVMAKIQDEPDRFEEYLAVRGLPRDWLPSNTGEVDDLMMVLEGFVEA
jgi:hypothetical protein